jgi:hypothetical protein
MDVVERARLSLRSRVHRSFGTALHLTADVLLALLRQISGAEENPDLGLLEKIYRRLQDSSFDPEVFRREKLIFLSQPTPRWLQTSSLVWDDAGEVFDEDFGYVALTYGNSELHRFFTEKLDVPALPDLKRYASVWANLCAVAHPNTVLVEKKMKLVLQRLADGRDELSNLIWWVEMKVHLTVWATKKVFLNPTRTYVPDHGVAAEVFAAHVAIAFPPKPTPQILTLLRGVG